MKIRFYFEGLTEQFERFTLIGVQLNKGDEETWITFWILGAGVSIIWKNNLS